jgi:hypothetical protein
VGEGPSDEGLIPHLESLCIELGAEEVTGTPIDFQRLVEPVPRTVEGKLRAAMQLEPTANLFFVHRDADGRDPRPRYVEIEDAVRETGLAHEWVPVVPVQETEAWLLLDEAAIREVAGRPRGRVPLHLPKPGKAESMSDPKKRLKEALVAAAELTGRRLEKFQRSFPGHRRLLLQRLPIGGPLLDLPSWVCLRRDLAEALARCTAGAGPAP